MARSENRSHDRRRGPTTLGQSVDRVTTPAMRRRGFAGAAIATEWGDIVGRPLSDHTRPERVTFPRGARREGTLHLRVAGAFAPEVQHLAPQIIERINACFGYRAIARIELHNGPVAARPPTARARRLPPAPPPPDPGIDSVVAAVEDESLRAALARLVRARARRAAGGENADR